MKIILGIDPALNNTGWAVITAQSGVCQYIASGVVKTSSSALIHHRLALIAHKLEQVMALHSPKIVAMEETFINTNAVSSLKLGYASGAIMALIGKYNLELQQFKPNQIKKTVTGLGHADKQQMLKMVKILLPSAMHVQQFDEADAIGIAYTCAIFISNLV